MLAGTDSRNVGKAAWNGRTFLTATVGFGRTAVFGTLA
jgi:hypothetical protein